MFWDKKVNSCCLQQEDLAETRRGRCMQQEGELQDLQVSCRGLREALAAKDQVCDQLYLSSQKARATIKRLDDVITNQANELSFMRADRAHARETPAAAPASGESRVAKSKFLEGLAGSAVSDKDRPLSLTMTPQLVQQIRDMLDLVAEGDVAQWRSQQCRAAAKLIESQLCDSVTGIGKCFDSEEQHEHGAC